MKWEGLFLAGLVIFVILYLMLGQPSEVQVGSDLLPISAKWPLPKEAPPVPSTVDISPDIRIVDLTVDKPVYLKDNKVAVNFYVYNQLGIPYNVTVDWLYENRSKHGWFNVSTEVWDLSFADNNWTSWYYPTMVGNWQAYVQIEFVYNNRTNVRTKLVDFRVLQNE